MAGSGVTLSQIILQAKQLGFTHWRVFSLPSMHQAGMKDERWADFGELLECESATRRQPDKYHWIVVDGGVDPVKKILWTVDQKGRRSEVNIRKAASE